MEELRKFPVTASQLEMNLKEASRGALTDPKGVLRMLCKQSKVIHELGIALQERYPESFPTIKDREKRLLRESAELIFKLQTDILEELSKSKEKGAREIVESIEEMVLYIDSYILPYLLRVEVTERFYEVLRYAINELADKYLENNGRGSMNWKEISERIDGLTEYGRLIGLQTPNWPR